MSITIEVDLPEALVNEARAGGLLNSGPMSDLISRELRRRKAAAELASKLDEIRSVPGEPLSMEAIQAEVEAVRRAKRAREAGR